jgi:hypothetical protein
MPRMIRMPVVAALCVIAFPAAAHHGDEDKDRAPSKIEAADAAHVDNAAPPDLEGLPSNEMPSSDATTVSSPAKSLHASPKIMNDVGASNDLKAAMRGSRPAEPLEDAAAVPAAPPAPDAATHADAQAPENYELQVGPAAAASTPAADSAPATRQGALLLPLLAAALLSIGAGFFFSRMTRRR